VHGTALGMEVEEADFPISDDVRTVSDLLGLNPMEIANEGVFVAVVAGGGEKEALDALRAHRLGTGAHCVGHVSTKRPGTVIMGTRVGGRRVMDFPRGLLLPRIC
jgi:hydrogenase expression/formation protein HypE